MLDIHTNNTLFLVSGNSGGGKTVTMKTFRDSNLLSEIVSFTTRTPRQGEVDGIDYIFVSKSKYDYLLSTNGIIENTEYGKNFYGITRKELESKLNKNNCYAIVDYNGMVQLKKLYKNTVTIFIYNSMVAAAVQMKKRGDEQSEITKRLSTYKQELGTADHYDYVIHNMYGYLDGTIENVKNIIMERVSK